MIVDELELHSNRIQPERLPRPIISTIDTWDQSTQVDYPTNAGYFGRRAGWNIPSIAVTNEAVNTIRSSSVTRAQSIRLATKAGFHPDPITNSFGYTRVPNMSQAIQVDSSVQMHFTMNAQTAAGTTQAPYFALFRDNVKISQEYRASATTGIDFLVSGSFVDQNPPKGWRVYDLRWHIDPSQPATLTATGKNRTFQVSNLRAQ